MTAVRVSDPSPVPPVGRLAAVPDDRPADTNPQPPKPEHRGRPLQSFSPAARRLIVALFEAEDAEYRERQAAIEAMPAAA